MTAAAGGLAEIVLIFAVGFLPPAADPLANALVSFTCAMQVQAFRKVNGSAYASTMCIGNLRSALQSVDDYIVTRKRGFLENGVLYFGVIVCFVAGAVMGNWFVEAIGLHAIAVCSLLDLAAFLLMFIDREHARGPLARG